MTYSQAIDYLYARLPVFHRIGAKALKPGLDNTLRLCRHLGNPQYQFKSIHVGGTNGKGSSSHYLAAVLQSAGYRTGLYTSPHLKSFTERIRLNGLPIPEEEVARFVTEQQSLIETVEPSFFEVTVALAFDYFARQQVDVAIIEVGLGGRLDSTNVILPLVSLITNIGWDHSDILGDSLPKIAAEKAGIIKPGVPVVVSEHGEETDGVFKQKATETGSILHWGADTYRIYDDGSESGRRRLLIRGPSGEEFSLESGLLGSYQLKNIPGVLTTLDCLRPHFGIDPGAIQRGFRDVVRLTGLKGRWQILQTDPLVICDTAHNEPGLTEVLHSVRTMNPRRLHLVLGFVRDKDLTRVIRLFPSAATYYFCQPSTPRALPYGELKEAFAQQGRAGVAFPEVNDALSKALENAEKEDLILVTGSTYLVADLKDL